MAVFPLMNRDPNRSFITPLGEFMSTTKNLMWKLECINLGLILPNTRTKHIQEQTPSICLTVLIVQTYTLANYTRCLGQPKRNHACEFKDAWHSLDKQTFNCHIDIPLIYLQIKRSRRSLIPSLFITPIEPCQHRLG